MFSVKDVEVFTQRNLWQKIKKRGGLGVWGGVFVVKLVGERSGQVPRSSGWLAHNLVDIAGDMVVALAGIVALVGGMALALVVVVAGIVALVEGTAFVVVEGIVALVAGMVVALAWAGIVALVGGMA